MILRPRDESGDGCPRFAACWEYEGVGGDPERPHIELKMTCRAEALEDALRNWDEVMTNFVPVRKYRFP